jgi:hypothetical protein
VPVRFRDRWLELRGEAITRVATEIRAAQSDGYCPGVDPVLAASALSAMLEHFCYIWLGQGGEKGVPFDSGRALDALATIWVKAVYWRDAGGDHDRTGGAPAERARRPLCTCPGTAGIGETSLTGISWSSHPRLRRWRKNGRPDQKEVNFMAHVEHSSRGFERNRHDHRRDSRGTHTTADRSTDTRGTSGTRWDW